MSEQQSPYNTGSPEADEALEMLGKGYEHPAVIITPPTIEIAMGDEPGFIQTKSPAFVKMSTAFKKHMKKLKGARLAIWLYIALSINDQGTAYPGIEAIMRDTGFSNREVIDSIREIEALGYLTVKRRPGYSSLYRVVDFVAIGKDNNPTSEVTSPVKKSAEAVKKSAITHDETSLKPDSINQIFKPDYEQKFSKSKPSPSKKGDLVDGLMFYSEQAKARGEDAIEKVLNALERLLHRNIQRSGQWQDLARWMLKRKESEPYQRWAEWYMADAFQAKTSWRLTPDQVRACWPQAFAEPESAADDARYKPYTAENSMTFITPEEAREWQRKLHLKKQQIERSERQPTAP